MPQQLPKKPIVKTKSAISTANIRKVMLRRSLRTITKPKDVLSSTNNSVKEKVVPRPPLKKTTKPIRESIERPRASAQKRAALPSQPSRNTRRRLEQQAATSLSSIAPIHTTTQATPSFILQEINPSPLLGNSIFNASSSNESRDFVSDSFDFSSFMVPLPPTDLVLPTIVAPTIVPPHELLPDNNQRNNVSNFFPQPPAPPTVIDKSSLFSKFSLHETKKDKRKKKREKKEAIKFGEKGEYRSGPDFRF